MPSIVLELQQEALDKDISTTDLLRKALVVARKLKVKDIEAWLSSEMNGYSDKIDIPKYRELRGDLKAFNPINGWIPVHMEDTEQAEMLSTRSTAQSISELESTISGEGDSCYMKFTKDIEQRLMRSMNIAFQPALFVTRAQILGVIEKTRNTVLDWALSLEESGITGEGMSFSKEEKESANNVTFNIKNLIGNMQDSQIQQDNVSSNQTYNKVLDLEAVRGVINELSKRISELELGTENEDELKSEISCINTQLDSPKPKIDIIKECLLTARNIVEGSAGSALFQGVLTSLGSFL
jgi:hypothetical protein